MIKRYPHPCDPTHRPQPESEPPPALDPFAPPFELEQPSRLEGDDEPPELPA